MLDDFDNLLQSEALGIARRGNSDLLFGGSTLAEFQSLAPSITSTQAPLLTSGLAGFTAANLATQQDRATRFDRLQSLRGTRRENVQLEQSQQAQNRGDRALTEEIFSNRNQENIRLDQQDIERANEQGRNVRSDNSLNVQLQQIDEQARANRRSNNTANRRITQDQQNNSINRAFQSSQQTQRLEAVETPEVNQNQAIIRLQGAISNLANDNVRNDRSPESKANLRIDALGALVTADQSRAAGNPQLTPTIVGQLSQRVNEAIAQGDFLAADTLIDSVQRKLGLGATPRTSIGDVAQ